jgi:tripartite-type tricarboxylate transporter receptor subunit TctC
VDLANAQTHVNSGKLRALAINGPKRSALLPDVPTFTGYDLYGSTPAQMGQMLRDDGERWGKVIAALGGLALD